MDEQKDEYLIRGSDEQGDKETCDAAEGKWNGRTSNFIDDNIQESQHVDNTPG